MRSHELAAANAWILTRLPALLAALMVVGLVPLAVTVANLPHWLRRAAWITGALAAAGLVAFDPGTAAILTVAPYAAFAIVTGFFGLRRFALAPSRIATSVGLMFVPAAATWLVCSRAGYELLGYAPFWVLLTSAHFHVAGVSLLVILGEVTRDRGRIPAAIALACVLSVPLTAAGIYGPRWLETAAAVGMATSAFAAGILFVTTPRTRIAGALLLVSMPLAGLFALRDHGTAMTFFGFEPLGSMLASHGLLNVLAAFIALIALSRRPAET